MGATVTTALQTATAGKREYGSGWLVWCAFGGELDCLMLASSSGLTHELWKRLRQYEQVLRGNRNTELDFLGTINLMNTGVLDTSVSLLERKFRGDSS